MAHIYSDTAKAIKSSTDIISIAQKLESIKNDLDQITLDGILDVSSRVHIDEELNKLRISISSEAAKMNSLGDALQAIVDKYRETETAIIEDVWQTSPSVEAGTDKRNWLGKFWDWITRQEPDEYDTTNLEQEKAADAAMKAELWYVLQNEKYSQETWDKASIDERKQILQDYMDEVIKIYGLEDVKPKIEWDSEATYTPDEITWGYYTHGRHSVTLNEQALSDGLGTWDSYLLLGTVTHELRHAYQHEAIDHPTRYMVSKETIDTWKDNFRDYISSDDDFSAYYAQVVEVDARDFEVNRDNRPTPGQVSL